MTDGKTFMQMHLTAGCTITDASHHGACRRAAGAAEVASVLTGADLYLVKVKSAAWGEILHSSAGAVSPQIQQHHPERLLTRLFLTVKECIAVFK